VAQAEAVVVSQELTAQMVVVVVALVVAQTVAQAVTVWSGMQLTA
jgi:hypothetical protein